MNDHVAGLADPGFIGFDHSWKTFTPSPDDNVVSNHFFLGSSLSSFSGIPVCFRYLLNLQPPLPGSGSRLTTG
ncbi:MAG: hypothetical protein ABI813_02945 [Bacteroidota bacterium]